MNTQQREFYRILVIGDSCIDKYHYGEVDRISPEAPVPVLRHLETVESPGMALNVALNLRAFGAAVEVKTNKEYITKERFVDVKSKHHLLRADYGESEKVSPLGSTNLEESYLCQFDAIVVSDYNKGFIDEFNIATLMENLRRLDKKIPVFVDTKKTDLTCFKNCIVKINEKENAALQDKARLALFEDDIKIIVTLGPKGATFQGITYPTDNVEVVDVSGAGDTFLAALTYGYLATSGDYARSIKYANKCAGIVVEKSGTYALKEEDLESVVL